MRKGDGGPAFPAAGLSDGMSLRDWFAGMAMQGMLGEGGWERDHLVGEAFIIADEMLKTREL